MDGTSPIMAGKRAFKRARKKAGVPKEPALKFETSGASAKHLRGERLERTRRREEIAEPVPNNRDCYIGQQLPFCNAA